MNGQDIYFYGYQSSIIPAFTDIHLDILGFLRISMDRLATDSRSRVSILIKLIKRRTATSSVLFSHSNRSPLKQVFRLYCVQNYPNQFSFSFLFCGQRSDQIRVASLFAFVLDCGQRSRSPKWSLWATWIGLFMRGFGRIRVATLCFYAGLLASPRGLRSFRRWNPTTPTTAFHHNFPANKLCFLSVHLIF